MMKVVIARGLMSSVAAIGLAAAFGFPAFAQSTSSTSAVPADVAATATGSSAPAGSSAQGEIIVTGSRIAQPEITAATPVSIVNSRAIEQTGQGNIQDVIAELPSVGSANLSRSTTNFVTNGNGTATINLRNLGQNRTLGLINGRRSVGVAGASALDVNNIPTDLIDRVEVVTGGASAVYGSDAVAGVVNFVLKDKFDGVRIRAENTISDKGDDPRQTISITAGTSTQDDRGHLVANFTYDNDEGLRSADRSFSAHDGTKSSYAAQGLFSIDNAFKTNGETFTFDHNNNLKTYQGAAIDGYDRNQNRYLAVPVQRLQGAALGNYALTDSIKLYAEGEFTRTRSNASLEPATVGSSGAGAAQNFDGSAYEGIPITNPYIPDAVRQAMIAAGVDTLQFRRRSNDIFDRSNEARRTYWRAVGGIKGDITPNWHFDVSYEHSYSKDSTRAQDAYAPGYGAALNSIRDASGNIVCADAAARAAGCVPLNIFGFNTASAAAGEFVTKYSGPSDPSRGLVNGQSIEFTYNARLRQDDVTGGVTGTLFDLPGGPVSLAVGGEYRREHSAEIYDPYTQAGVTLGNQLSNTVGGFNVKEAYAEVVAPILKDTRFANYLGLEGAFRRADYSTVGTVNSFKVGGEYAPVSDIRFRAMYAQATRAPNIAELFAAQSQTFYGGVDDPCDQGAELGDLANPAHPRALPEACRAIPGVAATIAKEGSFTYTTAQLQSVNGPLGGNPNLKPETARTITLGGVLTPHMLPNFVLSVDYYRIKVKNAIGTIASDLSVQQCVATGNPVFCSNVTRDANGFVTNISSVNLNTGSDLVSGIDVKADYHLSFASDDALDLSVYWNHLLKQQTVPYPGADVQKEVGQTDSYAGGRLGSGFHNRVKTSVTWTHGPLTLNYRVDYFSPLVTVLDDPDATHLKAVFYHNVQGRIAVGENKRFELYAGVNNLLDRKPPLTPDSVTETWPGTNTIASTYDVFGRMLYAGVDVKF